MNGGGTCRSEVPLVHTYLCESKCFFLYESSFLSHCFALHSLLFACHFCPFFVQQFPLKMFILLPILSCFAILSFICFYFVIDEGFVCEHDPLLSSADPLRSTQLLALCTQRDAVAAAVAKVKAAEAQSSEQCKQELADQNQNDLP